MTVLTLSLLRSKCEHHDDTIDTLQEISLHQLNLTDLSTTLNATPRLKILYLHNNLLDERAFSQMRKLKSLVYLNVTLNNFQRINEAVLHLEKLAKLDLTLNFIHIKSLAESLAYLNELHDLNELYLTGNPCTKWPMYRLYVIHQLPKLVKLDGQDITRSERIEASSIHQAASALSNDTSFTLSAQSVWNLLLQQEIDNVTDDEAKENLSSDYSLNKFTPENRLADYERQKAADQEKAINKSKGDDAFNAPDLWEAAQAKLNVRVDSAALAEGELPSQRNIAKVDFKLKDSSDGKHLLLTLAVPKYLDSSLIDIDLHPMWVQVMVKGKLIVLHTGVEINVAESSSKRLLDTGELCIKMKKTQPGDVSVSSNSPIELPSIKPTIAPSKHPLPGTKAYRDYVAKLDEEHAATIRQIQAKRSIALEEQRAREMEQQDDVDDDDDVPDLI